MTRIVFTLLLPLFMSSLLAAQNKGVAVKPAGNLAVLSAKTPGGMTYKVFRSKSGKAIHAGNYIKVHFSQKIRDSMYFTSKGQPPIYMVVPAKPEPYDISELWLKLKQGDSAIATQLMDTFIKRTPANIPPQFKKGDKIITTIKIIDVFTTDSLARKDQEKANKKWAENEIIFVSTYLSTKNINAQQTPNGAFVEIIKAGEGPLIDSGKMVSVNYTGRTFAGKVFDSNTDSSFQHVTPYSFRVGTVGPGGSIKGFDEGMFFMRKGTVARVYIPSMLAYGANPSSPAIKPYEHLIFDIEVIDVKDK